MSGVGRSGFFLLLAIAVHLVLILFLSVGGERSLHKKRIVFSLVPKGTLVKFGNGGKVGERAVQKRPDRVRTLSKNRGRRPSQTVAVGRAQTSLSEGSPEGNSVNGALEGQAGEAFGSEAASARERYLYELQKFLERYHKTYPFISKKREEEGKVEVFFEIDRTGAFRHFKIVTPCPFDRLNKAALELIQAIGRFKQLPLEIKEEKITFQDFIVYRIAS